MSLHDQEQSYWHFYIVLYNFSMASSELNKELFILFKSLFKFLDVIYKHYRPLIKCIILTILAYLAFRIGRSTIVDKLDESVKKLVEVLNNRVQYTIHLPQRMKKTGRIKKIVLGLLIISALAGIYAYKVPTFRKIKLKFLVKYIVIIAIVLAITLALLWAYELYLDYCLKKGRAKDLTINEQLYALQKELGPRAEGLLKIFLCKDAIIRYQSPHRGTCYKEKCKNYRQILKERVDKIDYLVANALNFNWCNVCKRRLPFNEFLNFQPQLYQLLPQNTQQQQLQRRNEYLFNELARMAQWIKLISPCNCSQIYWRESIRYIKEYKKQQKEIDQKLLILESRIYRK